MQSTRIESAKNTIIRAATTAGKMLKEFWDDPNKGIDLEFKGTIDIVTQCDKKAEDIIINIFQEEFSDFEILAEESGKHTKTGATHRWIIDPLDGTTSFAHGHPCFSVSLALQDIKENEIILGCVYNPTLDELFFAEKGKGATKNGKPIHVSKNAKLINSLVASGFPYDRKQCVGKIESNMPYFNAILPNIRGFRRNGSAAVDMCYVACGRQDAYWEWKLCPWDVAAGLLIVKEAGGKVTDLKGNEVDINQPRIHTILSNGLIHQEILDIMRKVDEESK